LFVRGYSRRNLKRIILSCLLLALFSSSLVGTRTQSFITNSRAVSESGLALNLSVRPPVLPADGGSYQALVLQFKNLTSGRPYIPNSNIPVYLTSSSPQTGTVPTLVTFQAGNLFQLINFSTTTLSGNTTISAIAAGYQLATLNVGTKTIGGIPNALRVFLSPNTIPPDKKFNSQVIVEAVDSFGNPVSLGSSLAVALSSSNTEIGTVPTSLIIPAGQSFAAADFSPTYIAGVTTITASAGNYSVGSAVMSTVGPIARRLVLSGPTTLPASSGQTALVSIQLQDNNSQTPALAPLPVSLVLTSNNTAVASVSSTTITIPSGSSYTTITITSGGTVGSANITASAQGYLKGSLIVQSLLPATAPNELAEYFVPTTLLPNNATYGGALVVQLEFLNNTNGQTSPAIAQNSVTIYARSSDNSTMQVATQYQGNQNISGMISSGDSEVAINIASTFLPGTSQITVQSPGLASSTSSLLSFGPAPNTLRVSFAPPQLFSDGKAYPSITVGLVDNSTGQPARAPVNTIVNLASTIASVGQVEPSVTIPAGQTFARATFSTFAVNGSTLITASASNYTSANATLVLVTKAATNLGVYTSPKMILGDGQPYSSIVVQLQDSKGNPEKTDVPITVRLSILNSSVGSIPQQVVISPGNTYAQIELQSSLLAGTTNVTAVATGFESGQTSITSFLLPLQVSSSILAARLLPGQRTNVSVLVTSDGNPISGADVNWSAGSGAFFNTQNQTDSNGTASAVYSAQGAPGAVLIFAQVSKPGFSTMVGQSSLRILNSTSSLPPAKPNFLETNIAFIPVWLLIVIVIAAPAGAFFFIKRRAAAGYTVDEEE